MTSKAEMNHIFVKSILLSFFSIIFFQGLSQSPETVVIHRDKAFYVSGETIWYKAYLPKEKAKSRILHIELLNQAGQSLIHQKLEIKDNQAFGELEIPYDWPSDLYTLRAYTLWNLNFPKEYISQTPISIYSFEESSPKIFTKSPTKTLTSDQFDVKIEVQPKTPSRREVVNLDIEITDKSGKPVQAKLSIGTADARFTQELPSTSVQVAQFTALPKPEPLSHTFSHQQKLLIKGQAKEEANNNPLESNYLIVWSVDDVKPIWTKAQAGQFAIELDDFVGEKTLQIHDFSPFRSHNPKIKLWSTNHISPLKSLPVNQTLSAKTVGHYLNLRQKRDVIKIVFKLDEPVIQAVKDSLISPFEPDKVYFLDKFIPFNTLESFITEGMPWVAIRRLNGEKNIIMENYDTKDDYELPPLILIDHHLSFKTPEMVRLPWKSLTYIEQFMRSETLESQFGLLGRFGVLSMYTKAGKPDPKFYEADNTFRFQGFHQAKKFPPPDFIESMYSKDKVPDFNPTVYWNPDIKTDQNGKATVKYIQLDGRGEYEIRLEGMTIKGEIFSKTLKYRVN